MKVIFYLLLFFVACRPSHLGELAGVSKDRPLEETFWVLKALNGKAVSGTEEKKMFLQFHKTNKTLSGFGGCNQLTGTYDQNGKKIKLTLVFTKMACGVLEIETAFFRALDMVNAFTIKEDELHLKYGSRTLANFKAEVKTMY